MRAHGTKFHDVYANDPDVYDAFSSAEKFDNQLSSVLMRELKGHRLLDVAAGTGEKTRRFVSRFNMCVAFDKSRALVDYGVQKHRTNNMQFVIGDASSLPFPDASFDCVLTTWGSFKMHKAIVEMKRVLEPGGRIIRIGARGKDELTSLFPNFSMRRVSAINRSYRQRGFLEHYYTVRIEFSSIQIAKKILSAVCGCSSERVTSRVLKHDVVLHRFENC